MGPRMDGIGIATMMAFFAMNGYGFYIWGAYGVTALALVAEVLALRSHRRDAFAQARALPDDPHGREDAA